MDLNFDLWVKYNFFINTQQYKDPSLDLTHHQKVSHLPASKNTFHHLIVLLQRSLYVYVCVCVSSVQCVARSPRLSCLACVCVLLCKQEWDSAGSPHVPLLSHTPRSSFTTFSFFLVFMERNPQILTYSRITIKTR